MFVPFEQLPDFARVWIYQSDRKLSSHDVSIITSRLRSFTEGWEVHGAGLPSSFRVAHDHFIILAAAETASGCSIDTSVRVMRELGSEIGVDFLDRSRLAIAGESGIELVPVSGLRDLVKGGRIVGHTEVFDNTLTLLGDLRSKWPAPAEKTWLKRFFANSAVGNKA